jgi:hypothetical protein
MTLSATMRAGACGLNITDYNTRNAWYFRSVTSGIAGMRGTQGFTSADAAHT